MADDGRRAERPILFSGAMVRGVLEGRKTQTRRVAKCLLPGDKNYIHCASSGEWRQKRAEQCPHGKPGDRLWLRENLKRPDGDPWLYAADDQPVMVDAQDETAMVVWAHHKQRDYCPSIHMPRWASRITLEVTEVRVERLQDISEEDAIAEGIGVGARGIEPEQTYSTGPCIYCGQTSGQHVGRAAGCFGRSTLFDPTTYRGGFFFLWSQINAKRGYDWHVNPWVWCVSFRRAERAA